MWSSCFAEFFTIFCLYNHNNHIPWPSLSCLSPAATPLGSRVAPKCKTCFTFRANMQIDSVLPRTVSHSGQNKKTKNKLLQFELIKKPPPQPQSASRSVIIKIANKSRITSRCNANNCFFFWRERRNR